MNLKWVWALCLACASVVFGEGTTETERWVVVPPESIPKPTHDKIEELRSSANRTTDKETQENESVVPPTPMVPSRARVVSQEEFDRIVDHNAQTSKPQGGVRFVKKGEYAAPPMNITSPFESMPPYGDGTATSLATAPKEQDQLQLIDSSGLLSVKAVDALILYSVVTVVGLGFLVFALYIIKRITISIYKDAVQIGSYVRGNPLSKRVALALAVVAVAAAGGWGLIAYPIESAAVAAALLLFFGAWGALREAREEKQK